MKHASEYSEAAARLFAGDAAPMNNPLFGLGVELMSEFATAEQLRKESEDRWLMDLRQYRGLYEPEEEVRMKGSKAYMRKTRVKVESIDARMMDLLFPANRERNFSVKATPEPNIPTPLKKKLIEGLTKLNGGQEPDAETVKKAIKEVADKAAARMETRIDDQLAETRYRNVARKVLHSGNLYGTGILKGPLVDRRTRVSYVWDDEKNTFIRSEQSYATPFLDHVPLWRWYPDMAVTDLEDARFAWEHHRFSRAKLAELAQRKTFRGDVIRNHIRSNPDGEIRLRTYEQELRMMGEQRQLGFEQKTGQYDVYERWGWLEAEKLRACGCEVRDEDLHEVYFANLWVLPDGQIIKAVLQPIEGMLWPYHLYYLDKDETSIFGEGFAAIMRGDQKMLNASVRMLLDNAAVTAGPQFEVFVPAFPASANLTDIHPLKVWPRTGGDFQYPAIRPLDFNSHLPELVQMMQIFDANADEVTAVPKFTYGDNPQRGAAGTMGGLSMLLGQANISLKDFVISWDEGITKPFIGGLYHWNMRFSADDRIKGDFEVVALGASSLVAKEVRGQALANFGATLQPEERGYIKWDSFVQQKADAMDLADVVKTADEVAQEQNNPQAQQMSQMQQQLQQALMQAQLAELQAKANKLEAEAMAKKIDAVYAAMQAAGVAAQNPAIAPAGDGILQSAGWQDADQQPGSGAGLASGAQAQQGMPQGQGAQPASAFEGARAGIETEEVAA